MSPAVVSRKLAQIVSRTARVRELLPDTVEGLGADQTRTEALILNLYLALQECCDLAMHVVADRGLGVPGTNREAFGMLARGGLIEADLGRRLAAAVGLRNRIAHEYGTLDLDKIWDVGQNDLSDLDRLAAAIAIAYERSAR